MCVNRTQGNEQVIFFMKNHQFFSVNIFSLSLKRFINSQHVLNEGAGVREYTNCMQNFIKIKYSCNVNSHFDIIMTFSLHKP